MEGRHAVKSSEVNLTYNLDLLTNPEGDHFNIIEKDNISILISPKFKICQNKHIFVIPSAMDNVDVRNKGTYTY